jgi:aminoglycoside phosphotransferase (APT) family kinase protein
MLDPSEMPARLAAFLAEEVPGATDVEVHAYEVMTGGYSRLLARAEVSYRQEGRHHRRTFVLRGDPPPERSLIFTDRRREYEVVRAVAAAGVLTPDAHHFDAGDRLATPTIVLDFSPATSLLVHLADRADPAGLARPLAEAAASFHRIPLDALPAQLERPASWEAYLTDRIDEWRRTAAAHVEALPVLQYVAAWLDAHRPEPVPLSLIHGDFQSSNLMVTDDDRIVMVDWELAQIGDPREDLGYFKAVAQAAPPDLIGLDEAAFCARYNELMGFTDAQVNPAVIAYFLILGVIGTVRRLLEAGAAFARGENTALNSVFNARNCMFGQSMWLQFSEQLEQAFAAAKEA